MKKIFLPAALLGLVSVTSCTKESKTVAAPKGETHMLTVNLPDGRTRNMPLQIDGDISLSISADEKTVTITEANGTVRKVTMRPPSEMDPETLQGIQNLIDESRAKEAQAGKPISATPPAKSGNWKDAAHYLQNGYKKVL